jgi:hypothetical protein
MTSAKIHQENKMPFDKKQGPIKTKKVGKKCDISKAFKKLNISKE